MLRADAQALAPDVLTLRRMARSGIPLRLMTLLQRPAAGLNAAASSHITAAVGAPPVAPGSTVTADGRKPGAAGGSDRAGAPGRRSSITAKGTDLAAPSTIPMDPPAMASADADGDIELIGAEEYAVRLGVDAYAGDPIVAMRSHEAIEALRSAAKTACSFKLKRSLMRALTAMRLQKKGGGAADGGAGAGAGRVG